MDLDLEKVNWDRVQGIFAPEKEAFLKRLKKGIDKYPLAKDSLLIVAGFGLVGLVILMPGVARVAASGRNTWEKGRYRRMWKRFEKQKWVTIRETGEGPVVEITQDGLKRALKYKLETMKIKSPVKWDGKWRIVIFDVKEQKRSGRNRFRGYLQNLGFYMLNRSVFVHPFPCFDEVEFIRQISSVGREVTYIVAESIESASDLRAHFGLDKND